MKVNIIVPWARKRKRLINRMLHYLQSGNGWTVCRQLDEGADVNYVFSYVDSWKVEADPWRKYREWKKPLAGFFTHRVEVGIKRRLWHQAAETVNLRIADSAKYAGMLRADRYGPTEKVTIPIRRDMFTLTKKRVGAKPIIGVSGFCVRSGRKGDALVYELSRYPPARHWKIVAAGRGWPVRTKTYRWAELPQFYHRLDLYLCTSLYEAGPHGPLEALACGLPIVIPIDVGAMDELPVLRGIYRYGRGDFDGMYRALVRCVGDLGTHDREQLRHVTRKMTPDTFCAEHRDIFERYFGLGKHQIEFR